MKSEAIKNLRTTQIATAAERARIYFSVEVSVFLADWFIQIVNERLESKRDLAEVDIAGVKSAAIALARDSHVYVNEAFKTLKWCHTDETVVSNYIIEADLPRPIKGRLRCAMAAIEQVLRDNDLIESENEWQELPTGERFYTGYVNWTPELLQKWQEYCEAANSYLEHKARIVQAVGE